MKEKNAEFQKLSNAAKVIIIWIETLKNAKKFHALLANTVPTIIIIY